MADFTAKSAIFCALGRLRPLPQAGRWDRIAVRMAELLMKSAISTLAWRCFDQ